MIANGQNLKIDDEFKTLIPPLTVDEFEQLEQNIIAEGCREPLITWNGFIVDGHNRFEICTKYGIEFKTIEKAFDDKNSAKEWIIRNQFGRRNLTPYQRTTLALRLKDVIEARANENQALAGGDRKSENAKSLCQNSDKAIEPIDTKKELAKIAGVSHDTVWKVEKIQENATPEEKEELQKGSISVHKVYSNIREREGNPLKPKKQKEEIDSEVKNGPAPSKDELTPTQNGTRSIMIFYDVLYRFSNAIKNYDALSKINEAIDIVEVVPEPYAEELETTSKYLSELVSKIDILVKRRG